MKRIAYLFILFGFFALSAFECGDGKELLCPSAMLGNRFVGRDMAPGTPSQNTATGAVDADPKISDKSVVFSFSDDQKNGTISGHTFVNTISGGLYARRELHF